MPTVRGLLLDTDYVTIDGRAWVRLWLATDDGHVFVHDPSFEPYFFAVPDAGVDAAELAERIAGVQAGDATPERATVARRLDGLDEVEVVRIVATRPGDVPALRTKVRTLDGVRATHEDDIVFASRYVIDRDLPPMTWVEADAEPDERVQGGLVASAVRAVDDGAEPDLHVLAFDLEVYNPNVQPDTSHDPIVAISMASNRGYEDVLVKDDDATDKGILNQFIDAVAKHDPDVLVTYNGDGFDWPYLKDRARIHGIPLRVGRDGSEPQFRQAGRFTNVIVAGRANLDAYRVAARDLQDVKVKTLENVAEHLGVMARDERTNLDTTRMAELWDDVDMRDTIVAYAQDDAHAALGIALEVLPMQVGLCRRTRQGLTEGTRMGRGRQVDWYLLAEAHAANLLAPNRDGGGGTAQYEGGVVFQPPKGVFEDVVYLDFSSMYPSIMVAYNVSPETLVAGAAPDGVDVHEAPHVGHRFRAEPDGFFKRILTDLIEARRAARSAGKDVEQQVLKVLTNSFYGYMGWVGARWYRRECAEATTAWGRSFIDRAAEIADELGLDVLYGDTDSVMVQKHDNVDELVRRVNAELPVELEVEATFKTLFFTGAKKRYAGMTTDGQLVVRGLEVRRGDWCDLAKSLQLDVITSVLEHKTPERAVELTLDAVERVRAGDVPLSELTIHKTLTMDPEKYKGRQAHVAAIQRAMSRHPDYRPVVGAKVGYVIVASQRRDPLVSDRAHLVDFVDDATQLDAEYYVENQLVPAAMRVLEYFGVTEEQLTGAPEQSSLKDWF